MCIRDSVQQTEGNGRDGREVKLGHVALDGFHSLDAMQSHAPVKPSLRVRRKVACYAQTQKPRLMLPDFMRE